MDGEGFFSRSEALLGRDGLARLASARALVVGIGGVGSWCAEALVRTGVGHVTLVDDDYVSPSNVNRQCPALSDTVGLAKVEVMRARLMAVNPRASVVAVRARFVPGNGAGVNLSAFDFVVDAIDSVDCKAALLFESAMAGVPVVSSMGAACRVDPTRVRVSPFEKVEGDGLARALRRRFRKTGCAPGNFACVWSDEPPRASAARGSLMPVTATFGMCLAAKAIEGLRSDSMEVTVAVAFGSNLEPRREALDRALEAVGGFPQTHLVAASEVEETEPVDVPEEFRTLKFLNRVALFRTHLPAREFSDRVHALEAEMGRVRTVKNGPRTIDIDLIDYGGVRCADAALTLPHPRARERDFVWRPWRQLLANVLRAESAPL